MSLRTSAHRLRYQFKSCCGVALASVLLAMQWTSKARAASEPSPNPRTTYGEIGLLDMPSARMAPDGELSLTASVIGDSQRYNLGFQILPWLEGSFRYSRIGNFLPGDPVPDLYDRSFSLKGRLFAEGEFMPEISLGIRDIVGTGVYSAEYVVASKRLGDFDFTLGAGWGRLATSGALNNPFAKISSSFEVRQGGNQGRVNFGQFFHGSDMGVFGGINWHTPLNNIDLILEYSSDRYVQEKPGGALNERAPVNVGIAYQPFTGMKISAGWFYGTTYGLTVSLSADPKAYNAPAHIGPPVPEPQIRSDQEQSRAIAELLRNTRPDVTQQYLSSPREATNQQLNILRLNAVLSGLASVRDYDIVGHTLAINVTDYAAAGGRCAAFARLAANISSEIDSVAVTSFATANGNVSLCAVDRSAGPDISNESKPVSTALSNGQLISRLNDEVAAQDIKLIAVYLNGSGITVYFENNLYHSHAEAAGRIARVLMRAAPPDIEIFHLVPVESGMTSTEIQVTRSSLERAISAYAGAGELGSAISLTEAPLGNPAYSAAMNRWKPELRWSLAPALRQVFFDPFNPLQIQLYAQAKASLQLLPGLTYYIEGEANLANNFDTSTPSDSVLPHVRSDVNQYFKKGINGIREMDISYDMRLAPDLFAEIRGGYLEDMFAGFGGQLLWRPNNGRWSFGLDAYQVYQRNFDRLFGLQDYQTFTGHASVYYQSPWYDLNFAIHAGRYLAKDYGATFEITRRFSTGVEIGAFATLTDVPFSKFGEGSFDKGLIIRIPFQWALPVYTQSQYNLILRSITRDGGARLDGDDSLYRKMLGTSSTELANHFDDILYPEY